MKNGSLVARDVMGRDIVTIPDVASVWDIAKLFSDRGIHGAPVVDKDGRLVGVVSQTDLVGYLRQISQSAERRRDFYVDLDDGPRLPAEKPATARELMNSDVITASEDTPVEELSRMLLLHHIHRVIITAGDEIRGVVTTSDLLRAI